jgi:hypothetical protein
MQIGDTVNLVRKITNEILPMQLTAVLSKAPSPMVEVRWKSDRYRYKLDIDKNLVLAIDSTNDHRQSMRVWYTISEDHRRALTELFWNVRKTGKGGRIWEKES